MEISDTDRMDGWSEKDDWSHRHTLLKQCVDCGWWTMFEEDTDARTVMSHPKMDDVKKFHCMKCAGQLDPRSTISWRSFFSSTSSHTKDFNKVEEWNAETAPASRFELTREPEGDTTARGVRVPRSVQPRNGRKPLDRNKRRTKVQEGQEQLLSE